MRVIVLACAVLLSVFVSITESSARPTHIGPRVRTDSRLLADSIRTGAAQSPTFADLVARLQMSDLLVFVEFENRLPTGLGGRTRFVTVAGGVRYVRIGISRRLSGSQQIWILAHELRHAVEIAASGEVVDRRSLARLYQRIGIQSTCGPDCYESLQAVETGRAVERELQQWVRHPGNRGTPSVRPTD